MGEGTQNYKALTDKMFKLALGKMWVAENIREGSIKGYIIAIIKIGIYAWAFSGLLMLRPAIIDTGSAWIGFFGSFFGSIIAGIATMLGVIKSNENAKQIYEISMRDSKIPDLFALRREDYEKVNGTGFTICDIDTRGIMREPMECSARLYLVNVGDGAATSLRISEFKIDISNGNVNKIKTISLDKIVLNCVLQGEKICIDLIIAFDMLPGEYLWKDAWITVEYDGKYYKYTDEYLLERDTYNNNRNLYYSIADNKKRGTAKVLDNRRKE